MLIQLNVCQLHVCWKSPSVMNFFLHISVALLPPAFLGSYFELSFICRLHMFLTCWLCSSLSVSRLRLTARRFTYRWTYRFWNGLMKLVTSYQMLRFRQQLTFTIYMGLTMTHPIVSGMSVFSVLVIIILLANSI